MKIVKIICLSGLVISALPTFAHAHEELEKQNAHLRKQLMEERAVAQEAVFQLQKENARLSLELGKSWGWKKKVGTLIVALVIGRISSQYAKIGNTGTRPITAKK